MADVKLSDLPAAAALTGAETAPITQAGQTVKATVQAIANLAGTSNDITLAAGATIQGFALVRAANGSAYPVDTSQPDHAEQIAGVATQSVTSLGADVIVRPRGVINDPAWNWAPGAVYCGPNGALTQAPSTTGWLLNVGHAINPTSIDIQLNSPIHRG